MSSFNNLDQSGTHPDSSPVDNNRELEDKWSSLQEALRKSNLDGTVNRAVNRDIPSSLSLSARDSWKEIQPLMFSPDVPDSVSKPEASAPRIAPPNNKFNFVYLGITLAVLVVAGLFTRSPWPANTGISTAAVYSTPAGSRSEIELPDGTRIMLNVGSRIEIPEGFGGATRTVNLTGEAYFIVAHSSGIPFTVLAADKQTTVLGTEFGVRAYPESQFQVAVRSGRVSVDTSVLSANHMLQVASSGDIVVIKSDHSINAALGFKDGKLIINNRKLRDAIPDLNRWYNAEIKLSDDALGDMIVDAVLMEGSTGDLMELLREILGVNVTRTDRELTLSRK